MDWNELLGYLKRFASSSLCQKMGYLLTLLGEGTGYSVPQELIQYLKTRVHTKTRLEREEKGRLAKDWLVTDNLSNEQLLSWWYHA